MEPAGGLKGGWRSFTTSVFGGGGGGGGAGGGGGECLSVREIQRLDHSMDSFVSVEDEGPGEDVSLLENRPVDQKKLRKRSHGHTQRLRLEDSDITSSSSSSSSLVPPSIERCQKNKPHPIHQHHQPHITQPNGHSSVSTIACTSSSTSLKSQSNPDGTAGGGKSLWQQEEEEEEEGWTYGTSDAADAAATAAAAAAAAAAVVKSSTDVEEHSSAEQKNLCCISNRARYNSFIDGILFTKQLAAAKEPALGNLIDFDNDGLSN